MPANMLSVLLPTASFDHCLTLNMRQTSSEPALIQSTSQIGHGSCVTNAEPIMAQLIAANAEKACADAGSSLERLFIDDWLCLV